MHEQLLNPSGRRTRKQHTAMLSLSGMETASLSGLRLQQQLRLPKHFFGIGMKPPMNFCEVLTALAVPKLASGHLLYQTRTQMDWMQGLCCFALY